MMNFLFCIVLPPGASEVDQTHKFYDFLDLIQFFHIWSDSVLIEMNDVNNFICNNFAYNNSWRYTVFPLGASKVYQKTISFCKIDEFCQLQWLLERKLCILQS